jgi:hypothetical protein
LFWEKVLLTVFYGWFVFERNVPVT